MFPLFETVCVQNRTIRNMRYHEDRFFKSFSAYYGKPPNYSLFNGKLLSMVNANKTYKLKICYHETGACWSIAEYHNKIPTTLQLVINNDINYELKFYNRTTLNTAHQLKNKAEDILIVKNGLITDTSYANILLKKKDVIATPKKPLLKGTCRARLISNFSVIKKDITLKNLYSYTHFQLINAMNDFNKDRWIPVKNIYLPQ